MDPTQLKAHLDSLCEQLDSGGPIRAVAWAGAALVATGALVGCFEEEDTATDQALYGAPAIEDVCDDEIDNDWDELTDCDDDDCVDDPACESAGAYGAPPA